jgi:hypothetical protein
MRGTNYGDFSRFPYRNGPYRSVLMQQGRVQLDADWNAQAVLQGDLLAAAVAELVGGSAAPAANPGYAIAPVIGLGIGPGGAAQAADAAPFRFGGRAPFTLEIWVCPAGEPGTLLECAGAVGEEAATAGYRLALDHSGSPVFTRGSSAGGHAVSVNAGDPLPPGGWVHLAAVFTGSATQVFVGGVLLGSERLPPTALPAVPTAAVFALGAVAAGEATAPAEIAGVRVWSSARSAAQLAAAAQAGPAGDDLRSLPRELVAWWPLDDAAGTAAEDLVSGNSLRFTGSPPPSWRLIDLEIGAGAYYVDGVRVELTAPARFTSQAARPGAPLPRLPGRYLVYLEAWERSVLAAEDPDLLEPALGGLDTSVRAQVAAGVSAVALAPGAPASIDPAGAERVLGEALAAARAVTSGGMAATQAASGFAVGNQLYRVEIHQGGHTADLQQELEDLAVIFDAEAGELRVAASQAHGVDVGRHIELVGVGSGGEPVRLAHVVRSVRRVRDTVHIELAADPSVLQELKDLRLRRPSSVPTFKWSRTNGSVALPIAPLTPGTREIRLLAAGPDSAPLRPGDVIELIDDRVTLGDRSGELLVVEEADYDELTVHVDRALAGGVGESASLHPFVRRWDHTPAGKGTRGGAVVLEPGRWIDLERGIQVFFDPGAYRRGDYWWVLTRQHQGVIWPDVDAQPEVVGAVGVERLRAPLALLDIGAGGVEVHDLRRHFGFLLSDPAGATPPPEEAPEVPEPEPSEDEPDERWPGRPTAWHLRRREE